MLRSNKNNDYKGHSKLVSVSIVGTIFTSYAVVPYFYKWSIDHCFLDNEIS